MDERVAKLKTSQDARQLAENAQQRGHAEVAAQALARARQLQAVEEGHQSPAQIAIASALYAYEEEQSRLLQRKFRANRTRQMFERRGTLAAAERMVMQPRQSTGFDVLDGAGLRALSFEAIIDQHPEEFSDDAIAAARARLRDDPSPPQPARRPPPAMAQVAPTAARPTARPALFDAEAQAFLEDFRNPTNRFTRQWLPEYRVSIAKIDGALAAGRHDDLFEHFWKTADNGIANAGQGLLEYAAVDKIKAELVQVIRDVHADSSPSNVEHIAARFAAWAEEKRIRIIPRLLIARVFAGIDSRRYHTTVDDSKQRVILQWFRDHTGFALPLKETGWGDIAEALGAHLDRCGVFTDHLERNVFPWFVFEQLRERMQNGTVAPGHTPGKTTASYHPPEGVRAVSLRHNALQAALYLRLASAYGVNRVGTEHRLATGGFADAVAQTEDGDWHLFEIKVADTAADVVRQAMGQLLEYGFREGGLNPTKLFAVGEPALDDLTQAYLERLHEEFKLDIAYIRITLPADWAESVTATPSQATASALSQ